MQVAAHPVQLDQLLVSRRCAVTDVVDPSGQRVDGRQCVALGDLQQPDAVAEVLGFSPGDLLAGPIRGLGVHAARLPQETTRARTRRVPSRTGRGRHR